MQTHARKHHRIPKLLVAALLLVASCATADGDDQADAPSTNAADAPAQLSLDRGTESSASCPETLTIGAAISQTGKFSKEGGAASRGFQTWLKWVNDEHGGLKADGICYAVDLIIYDDAGDKEQNAALVEKLIVEDEVDYMFGPYSSGITLVASEVAARYDMTMFAQNGASGAIFERGLDGIYGTQTLAADYTKSGIERYAAAGAQTMALAYEDTAFPSAVAEGALKWAEEFGIEVVSVSTYPQDVLDVGPIMREVAEADPDIFVGGGHFNDALLFSTAAQQYGFEPDGMLLLVAPSSPDFVDQLGPLAEGVVGPVQWTDTMTYDGPIFGTPAEYAARYEEDWGEAPIYQAASGAAATTVLTQAIELAGTVDPEAVRAVLDSTSFTTFYGPISFADTGANISKPMGAVQVQNGEIRVIGPEPARDADLLYPG